MKTKEIDVRMALRGNLEQEFQNDPSTIIVNEMQVCFGEARVDVAVINGSIHGYEIKSDSDTLERLAQQAECYSKVFDYITLVCSEKFIGKLDKVIPCWWGVKIASANRNDVVNIELMRSPSENVDIDPHSLVQLLWRDEALGILVKKGLDKGVRTKPKWDIWNRMVDTIDISDLKDGVRECLKKRDGWRADLLQKKCDG